MPIPIQSLIGFIILATTYAVKVVHWGGKHKFDYIYIIVSLRMYLCTFVGVGVEEVVQINTHIYIYIYMYVYSYIYPEGRTSSAVSRRRNANLDFLAFSKTPL